MKEAQDGGDWETRWTSNQTAGGSIFIKKTKQKAKKGKLYIQIKKTKNVKMNKNPSYVVNS